MAILPLASDWVGTGHFVERIGTPHPPEDAPLLLPQVGYQADVFLGDFMDGGTLLSQHIRPSVSHRILAVSRRMPRHPRDGQVVVKTAEVANSCPKDSPEVGVWMFGGSGMDLPVAYTDHNGFVIGMDEGRLDG